MALVHAITTTHLHMGTRPDANAASDSSAPDSVPKAFGEHHKAPYRLMPSDGNAANRPGAARQSNLASTPDPQAMLKSGAQQFTPFLRETFQVVGGWSLAAEKRLP